MKTTCHRDAESQRKKSLSLGASVALWLVLCFLPGCTIREVSHRGVKYRHVSFATTQSFGEMRVALDTNGEASVTIKNFANDQVSAIREVKETIIELNKLKAP